jgi:lysophospholipase L1-like esterase
MMSIKKIGTWIKDCWLMVGCTILLLCVLEGGLSLAFFVKDRLSDYSERRAIADTYGNAAWMNDYQEEARRAYAAQWRPYVYWRRLPYQGNYINVDANGLRLTTSMEGAAPASGTPLKVFMFGGSTMWGTGVRDDFTIPSVVAKELQQKGVAAKVVNFGESGYVSTQEVIALLLQLQKGERPDLVVFYDGVNDIYSAYQQRAAGLPQNEFNRVQEFNLSKPENFKRRAKMVLSDMTTEVSTMRLASGLLRRAGIERPTADDSLPPVNESLAQDVLAKYQGNIGVVKALSEHYHFKCLFYWQPTIFQKTRLTDYEAGQRAQMRIMEPFVEMTYDAMRLSGLKEMPEGSFHDLSMIFADVGEPLYTDWCHLGESGNERIGKSMANDILGLTTPGK